MFGSAIGSEMPPHPYGPYHSGSEGGPPSSFYGSRRHDSPGYFDHPDMRGQYSGEAPAAVPPPYYARAFRSAPPPSAPRTTEQHQTPPPMAASPQADNSDTSASHPRCGGARRRGCWWLWGRSSSSCPDKEARGSGDKLSGDSKLPADQSPPGNQTVARAEGRQGYYSGYPFSGRAGHSQMPAGTVTGEAEKASAGPTVDPRQFGPFPPDGSGGPPFHADDGKAFHGFHGDHSRFPAFHGRYSNGFPGSHGDPSGGFPGYVEGGGPPFHGDYGRFGPFGYGHPPFYGYRYPGGFYYSGSRPFQSGPESRNIFREFDFQ